eukprot:scaffold15259_cov69-Cyclotella_meneghiniana.AAC.3
MASSVYFDPNSTTTTHPSSNHQCQLGSLQRRLVVDEIAVRASVNQFRLSANGDVSTAMRCEDNNITEEDAVCCLQVGGARRALGRRGRATFVELRRDTPISLKSCFLMMREQTLLHSSIINRLGKFRFKGVSMSHHRCDCWVFRVKG